MERRAVQYSPTFILTVGGGIWTSPKRTMFYYLRPPRQQRIERDQWNKVASQNGCKASANIQPAAERQAGGAARDWRPSRVGNAAGNGTQKTSRCERV